MPMNKAHLNDSEESSHMKNFGEPSSLESVPPLNSLLLDDRNEPIIRKRNVKLLEK